MSAEQGPPASSAGLQPSVATAVDRHGMPQGTRVVGSMSELVASE